MKERKDKLDLCRAYDTPGVGDGCRILVDRVWPRGVSREQLRLDGWLKEIAPSHGLRKWFGHDPGRWDRFKELYTCELEAQPELVERLLSDCRGGAVTLVFGAKGVCRNNAVVLKEYLEIRLSVDREPRETCLQSAVTGFGLRKSIKPYCGNPGWRNSKTEVR